MKLIIAIHRVEVIDRCYVDEKAVIVFGLTQPSLYRRHHIQTDRARLVDIDDFRVGQQQNWLSLLQLSSRSNDVVDVDLVSHIVDILDLIAIESDLSVPQTLLLGDVADVEEQTKSVVIFESFVYFALCGMKHKQEFGLE